MSKTTKIIIWVVIALVVISGIWYGASRKSSQTTPTAKEPIKIGAILPLTGEAASWGQNGLAGMKLALQEINQKEGINGRRLELVVEDSKCSPKSVSVIQKLINVDKVDAVVGFVCSAAAGPALPVAKDNNTPTLLIAASAPHLTKVGNNVFRIYPSDIAQGKFAAEFVYNKLSKRKVAVLYTRNEWGEGLQKIFTKRFKDLGGTVVYDSGILQAETDFRTEISKIKESGAKVLYFPVYPKNAIAALKQIKEMGLKLPIIGGDILGGDEVVKSGYADDVLYTIGKINLPDGFKTKIKSLPGFAKLSTNMVAPLGYDGIKVIASAIQNANSVNKSSVINALSALSYKGISSPVIIFDENGDLKNPVFEVKVIKNKKSMLYSE